MLTPNWWNWPWNAVLAWKKAANLGNSTGIWQMRRTGWKKRSRYCQLEILVTIFQPISLHFSTMCCSIVSVTIKGRHLRRRILVRQNLIHQGPLISTTKLWKQQQAIITSVIRSSLLMYRNFSLRNLWVFETSIGSFYSRTIIIQSSVEVFAHLQKILYNF